MNVFKELINSKKSLNSMLFDEITDYEIYSGFLNQKLDLGRAYSSPLRDDDTIPSFSLFIPKYPSRDGEICWGDHARKDGGDVFSFVKKFAYLHYDTILSKRLDIVKFIDSEFKLGIFSKDKVERKRTFIDYEAAKVRKSIFFESREFTVRDKLFWYALGVSLDLLNLYQIKSVKYLLDERDNIYKKFGRYDLAFIFIIYDKVKLYRPEMLYSKFRTTCPANYIMGWEQLEGFDTIIITKSMKDILCFKSMMNVDVIAPQSENGILPAEELEYIDINYTNKFVVYDYDEAGIAGAERLEEHGFTVLYISKKRIKVGNKFKIINKDLSDTINNEGLIPSFYLLRQLFFSLDDSYFREQNVIEADNINKNFRKNNIYDEAK